MKTYNIIDVFLNPKSVAVIGASKNPLKGGHRILKNLIVNNFNGKIYPINPNSTGQIFNLEFKKSVLEIEDNIDIAIFYIPNRLIPGLLEECIEKEVKGAIIEASGFEEVGDKGLELRDQILKITDNFSKIRIVGPNCMGVTRIDGDSDKENRGGFFSSFAVFNQFKRGNIAIVSQSGMLNGGYLMHLMAKNPYLGFRYSCTIGNKMDISEIEFLEYLIEDPTVNVIAIYLESFRDPRKFIELCKKVRKKIDKTIILVKGGATSQGQKASLSHTAALSEDSQLIDAIIKQSGIIRAYSFHELFQYAKTFSMMYMTRKKFPKKGQVAMVAGSGGAGTITADLTWKYGLKMPILEDSTFQALVKVFPEWMPPNKFAFIDFWPAMEKAITNGVNLKLFYKSIYEQILNDSQIEGLFNMAFCSKQFRALTNVELLIEIANESKKPIFFWLVGEYDELQRVSQLLDQNNLLEFPSLEDMVKNFKVLVQESKNRVN